MAAKRDIATQLAQDARMTASRAEVKYLVAPAVARALVSGLDAHLRPHRHVGEGANHLPEPQHHVTTIYFDTESRALFRAARSGASHLKLRAKEYYDLHPGLTETATDLRQLVRYQPTLWLEVKSRDGGNSGKQRIGLPKHDVPAFFADGIISPEMIALQDQTAGSDGARRALEAVAKLCGSVGEPLRADCLVNYRRRAWQDDTGSVRITLDRDVAFYRPPADLWSRDWALLRSTLGRAAASEPRAILEVKLIGDSPDWLSELLGRNSLVEADFSKFEAASAAVHG